MDPQPIQQPQVDEVCTTNANIRIQEHFISEKNGPENKLPSGIKTNPNDICKHPDLELKKIESVHDKNKLTRFVQINSLADDRIEYLYADIEIKNLRKGKCNEMSVSAKKKSKMLGEENDHAGHLLAARLGGEGDKNNVIPQNKQINQGNWKKMENIIVNDVKENRSINYSVRVIYDDKLRELMKTRPKEILFKVKTLDGKLIRYGKVDNPPSKDVKNILQQYIIINFKKVWENDEKGQLFILSQDANFLNEIFILNQFTIKNEYFIWQVIHYWVKFNQFERLKHMPLLCKKYFQFKNLSSFFVDVFLLNCALFNKMDKDDKNDIYQKLKKAINNQNTLVKTIDEKEPPEQFEMFFGNVLMCISCTTSHVEVFDTEIDTWHSIQFDLEQHSNSDKENLNNELKSCFLSDKPEMNIQKCNFPRVILNKENYVLGKEIKHDDLKYEIQNHCERFNTQCGEWSTIAPMNIARKYASAVVYNDCIYIAGGINEKGLVERSVEKYDPNDNIWTLMEPMKVARRNFSLVLYDGRFWAIGGIDDNLPLASVESYDPINNAEWQKEEPLNDTRYNHGAIEFKKELYVIGGLGQNNDLIVERYDTEKNHWVLSSKLQNAVPKSHPYIMPIEDTFTKMILDLVKFWKLCKLLKLGS